MISRKDAMSRLTQAELASASTLEFRIDDAIREGDPTGQIRVDITGVPVRVRERVAQAYRDNGWKVTVREAVDQRDSPEIILGGS